MAWDYARHRDRVAAAVLRRVAAQRATLNARYGHATTTGERFAVAADALRAAAAPGPHQPDQAATDRELAALVDQLLAAVARLHTNQETAARRVIEGRSRRVRSAESRTPGSTA